MKSTYITDKVQNFIINIGVLLIYVALAIILVYAGVKYNINIDNIEQKNIATLIWNSMFSVVSGVIAFVDFVVAILFIKIKKQISKITIIPIAIITYLIVIFDDVAIQYPSPQSVIVIVNFVAFILLIGICLFTKTHHSSNLSTSEYKPQIQRVLQKINNKKIVAIQIYTIHKQELIDKIRFEITSNESRVRNEYDINSILHMTYEIEKEIVESFNLILRAYQEFVNSGKEIIKDRLILNINKEIEYLNSKLKTIESADDVSKDDCCMARILVLYLSFLHILSPDSAMGETPSNYIGEVSLCDGDLQIDNDIEAKLFTQTRTGLLGAILLGAEWRHVFKYKKHGAKQGRQYCASQLYSGNINGEDITKICLFSIEENPYDFIPPYILASISSAETQIQNALHKIYDGGDNNVSN